MRLGFNSRVGHGLTVGGTHGAFVNAAVVLRGAGDVFARGQLIVQGTASLLGRGSIDASDLLFFNGRAAIAGAGSVAAAAQLILSGHAAIAGDGVLAATGQLILSGASAVEALGLIAGRGQLLLSGSALVRGAGDVGATLTEHKLLLEDVRFYLTTAMGVVTIVGGLPVFSRASSAESEDAAGRALEALPNTPQYTWLELDGVKRPVLRLQPAHITSAGLQAVDRLYYPDGPGPGRDAFYQRMRIGWDPAVDSGHLLWLSDLTNAPPRLRVRHAGDSFFAELHNGAAAAEVEVEAPHETGQILELLPLVDTLTGLLELIVALDGEIAGSASIALPAGGLPADWSDRLVVFNGYDQFPTWSALSETKILSLEGFPRPGDQRLVDAREFVLSPAREVV